MLFAFIEDDATIAKFMSIVLEMQGYRMIHFFEGVSFIASLQTTSYDFILVGLNPSERVSDSQIISFWLANMRGTPMLVLTRISEWLLKGVQAKYPQVLLLQKPFHVQEFFDGIEMIQRSACYIAFGELVNNEFLRLHAGTAETSAYASRRDIG